MLRMQETPIRLEISTELVAAASEVVRVWDDGIIKVEHPFWNVGVIEKMARLRAAVAKAEAEKRWERV